jgi:hypothetical protein
MVAEEIAGKVEWRRPEMKQQRVRVKGGRGCGFGEIRALLEWCVKVILHDLTQSTTLHGGTRSRETSSDGRRFAAGNDVGRW